MDNNYSQIESNEAAPQILIHFEEGILGFEEIKEYLLYHEDNNNVIWSLQSASSDVPSFIVIDPNAIVSNYYPVLSASDLSYFGEENPENLCFLVIAVIQPNLADSVANLKAPIVIDINTKKAKQIILENSDYPIRYKLFENKK